MSDPAVPEGLQLAHTFWGEPDSMVTHAHTATGAGGVQLVSAGVTGTPYMGDRDSRKCIGNNDTCEAWKMTDGDFCVAHAGVLRRKQNEGG
jgi:hypothetical protein